MEPDSWRETRDAKNLKAYLEWERERANAYREFTRADAYELMDREPEQEWWSPPTTRKPRGKKQTKKRS